MLRSNYFRLVCILQCWGWLESYYNSAHTLVMLPASVKHLIENISQFQLISCSYSLLQCTFYQIQRNGFSMIWWELTWTKLKYFILINLHFLYLIFFDLFNLNPHMVGNPHQPEKNCTRRKHHLGDFFRLCISLPIQTWQNKVKISLYPQNCYIKYYIKKKGKFKITVVFCIFVP